MKINFERLAELNSRYCTNDGQVLGCFWVLQSGVEKILNHDLITDIHKNILIDMGILEENELVERNIVGQFKFTESGSQDI